MNDNPPIIHYAGPPHELKMRVRDALKLLDFVKGPLAGRIPNGRLRRVMPDGSTVDVQSIRNMGNVDIIRITVPSHGAEISKRQSAERTFRDITGWYEQPSPLIYLNSTIQEDPYYQVIPTDARVFLACKSAMEKMDADASAMNYSTTAGEDQRTDIEIRTLPVISDSSCSITIDETETTNTSDSDTDPEPGEGTPDSYMPAGPYIPLVEHCNGHSFIMGMLAVDGGGGDYNVSGPYEPAGGTFVDTATIDQAYQYDMIVSDGGATVETLSLESPGAYSYHKDTTATTVHDAPMYSTVHIETSPETVITPSPPYHYTVSLGYYGTCEDEDHVTIEENEDESMRKCSVIASAVVKGADGYDDYKTWGVFYVDYDYNSDSGNVYLVLYDPENGTKKYHIESVSELIGEEEMARGLSITGTAAIEIFDYYGKPYFVASYVGVELASLG